MSIGMYGGERRGGLKLWPILIGLLVIGGFMLKGCQEGPFGRSQLVAFGPAQEAQLGAQAFQEVLQTSDVVRGGPAVEAVTRLAQQLAAAAERPEVLEHFKLKPQKFDWDARVVRDRQMNAFCLPGGKIVVYTGILPVAETESALAAVMGHEISHALAHHGAERMAQQRLVQIGQIAVAGSVSDMDPGQQRAILGALGAGSKFGIILPFSREHESEADHMGLILMAAAGHHPKHSIELWQRMARAGRGAPPEWMSTHPGHETRIRRLEELQPEAMPFYDRAATKQPDRRLPVGDRPP
jgi:metalloendopeptidase OMA1, mitochondrial